jgi:hypothetical protein
MELEGVAAGVEDGELPGTLTSGYSKTGGLGRILEANAVTGSDTTGVLLFECCSEYCAGVFEGDFANISRKLFAASLSFMIVIDLKSTDLG